jgi:hypothetical protein
VKVRATANFAGARAGQIHKVDGRDPEVKSKIAKGWFVEIEPDAPEKPKPAARRRKK